MELVKVGFGKKIFFENFCGHFGPPKQTNSRTRSYEKKFWAKKNVENFFSPGGPQVVNLLRIGWGTGFGGFSGLNSLSGPSYGPKSGQNRGFLLF
jgi:hypothetical protein